jgi:hypothetical protein
MMGWWLALLIFDFFAGTGSATQAFHDAGHTVIKIELDEQFAADERDILSISADYLVSRYGQPHFVWASPPCTTFSVASCSTYWTPDGKPKNEKAIAGLKMIEHTIALIRQLKPTKGFIIENPRGMLRKQSMMDFMDRRTVTYCTYGETRMKPTDLWGSVNGWTARPHCKNGDTCHEAAPRGSKTGTQGIKGSRQRSMVPIELSREILNAIK